MASRDMQMAWIKMNCDAMHYVHIALTCQEQKAKNVWQINKNYPKVFQSFWHTWSNEKHAGTAHNKQDIFWYIFPNNCLIFTFLNFLLHKLYENFTKQWSDP